MMTKNKTSHRIDKFEAVPVSNIKLNLNKPLVVDFFAGVHDETKPLFNEYPSALRYPSKDKYSYIDISVPDCIKNTVIHKALAYQAWFSGNAFKTMEGKGLVIRRIFKYLWDKPRVDEKLLGVLVNDAIKEIKGRNKKRIKEGHAKSLQESFLSSINSIIKDKPVEFNEAELTSLMIIKRMTPIFSPVANKPTESISQNYKQLPYSNADYIRSIRQIAFVQYEIWRNIRSRFRTECPEYYKELRELLIEKRAPFIKLANSICQPADVDLASRGVILRIHAIIINVALLLDDLILIESVFLPLAYRRKNNDHSFIFREIKGVITLNRHVTKSYMSAYLRRMLKEDGSARSQGRMLKKSYRKIGNRSKFMHTGTISSFTPYALFLPFGPDELQFYAALFATDRCGASTLLTLTTDDILLLDSSGNDSSISSHAPKLKINGFKGRNGKKDGVIYSKGTPFYRVAYELKHAFEEAVESELLPYSNRVIFSSLSINESRFNGETIFGGELGNKQHCGKKARTFIPLIPGTHYNKIIIKNVDNLAFLFLLQSTLGKVGLYGSRVLSISSITQSRMYAEQFYDMSKFNISESFSLKYTEDLYNNISIIAPTQHHKVETRLDTYYQRSQESLVIESRENFAAQVGEQMVKMALELAKANSLKGQLVSIKTAKEICGLAAPEVELSAEELILQADAQGYLVNEVGFLQCNNITYIIKSPLHAVLIQKKIDHIDNEVEKLMSSNHNLVPMAIAQRMLLSVILKEFDETTIAKGISLYDHFQFSFPSLVITLGKF